MSRTVVLRHELPDGSHHFDWMLERLGCMGGDEDRSLVTFRLSGSPVGVNTLDAEAIADHRKRYLWYEGPVSDQRGHVTRVASGECQWLRHEDGGFEVMVKLDQEPGEALWVGHPVAGAIWRLVRHERSGR